MSWRRGVFLGRRSFSAEKDRSVLPAHERLVVAHFRRLIDGAAPRPRSGVLRSPSALMSMLAVFVLFACRRR